MEGKYESIIKYFTLNLKILKSNNIIIFANSDEIDKILDDGREKASYLANKMLRKLKKKMGLGRK